MNSLVSICIPTYNQTFLLKQNLDAIAVQTYKNFEVIVSDDSPGNEVADLLKFYTGKFELQYFKNIPSLGSPGNWNSVLQKAKGEYILLLHHDDKFGDKNALSSFVNGISKFDFVFGRNESIDDISNNKPLPASYFNIYYSIPYLMIVKNVIGAPSNVLFNRNSLLSYDERYKWVVDMEIYTRLFEAGKKFNYIDQHLIVTGRHEGQITNKCINNNDILVYENLLYAIDHIGKIKSIQVFDFFWRLLRNARVKSLQDIQKTGVDIYRLPVFIKRIVNFQKRFPVSF